MSQEPKLTRRQMLRGSVVVGLVTVGGAAALACGKDQPKTLTCTDTTGLSPTDAEVRKTLEYTDKAPDPAKKCSNCLQFEAKAAGQCGGCKVVKGPIHPDGWCKSWMAKPS